MLAGSLCKLCNHHWEGNTNILHRRQKKILNGFFFFFDRIYGSFNNIISEITIPNSEGACGSFKFLQAQKGARIKKIPDMQQAFLQHQSICMHYTSQVWKSPLKHS